MTDRTKYSEVKAVLAGRSAERPLLIAGPCSVENEEDMLRVAQGCKAAGAAMLRGGVWKPRTQPGGFEGVGAEALGWLVEAGRSTGLPVTTEVGNRQHTRMAVDAGVDALWIGARSTTNPFAVQEIADTLKELGTDIPVLVKNPVIPDVNLWEGAIGRIRNAGISTVVAVHRGFGVQSDGTYRNPPLWRIPIELHRRNPELLILHDPSHTGGRSELVAPLAQHALDMGFDGLMIECHLDPKRAMSDAAQQVTPIELADIMLHLVLRRETHSDSELEKMRSEIDELDSELMRVLGQRLEVCRQIGRYKAGRDMSVVQDERYASLISERLTQGESLGLGEKFTRRLLQLIHEESVRQQIEIVNQQSS